MFVIYYQSFSPSFCVQKDQIQKDQKGKDPDKMNNPENDHLLFLDKLFDVWNITDTIKINIKCNNNFNINSFKIYLKARIIQMSRDE